MHQNNITFAQGETYRRAKTCGIHLKNPVKPISTFNLKKKLVN